MVLETAEYCADQIQIYVGQYRNKAWNQIIKNDASLF